MTVTYGFYDSLNGDRKYNASQVSRLFEGIITDGIFQSVGGGFVVSPQAAMNINVATGRAWLNYTWTLNDATLVLTVDPSDPVLNRIDIVVIEVNTDVSVRANSIKIIKGTPATTPVAPTLANTATLKQYPLANISIAAGVTSINAGNITNRVAVAGGTPFITGLVQSFDVATLFGQFESNFQAWFQNLQDELDANQAANLQNQINTLVSYQNFGWILVSDTWTFASSKTVTVPTDATTKYKKGWGVRYKQGGSFKYGNIIAITSTLLTIESGTDFSVINAAITDISVCPDPNSAFGFPRYFNTTIQISGSTGTLGTYSENVRLEGKFTVTGARVNLQCSKQVTNKGSWGGTVQITVPIVPDSMYGATVQMAPCWWAAGAAANAPKAVLRMQNSPVLIFVDLIDASPLEWPELAVNDVLMLDTSYWY